MALFNTVYQIYYNLYIHYVYYPWFTEGILFDFYKYIIYNFLIILIAIRSGDYYMFDELEDEDIDLLPKKKTDDEEDRFDRPSMGEVRLNRIFHVQSCWIIKKITITGPNTSCSSLQKKKNCFASLCY